jgi:hypothetical protein
MDYDSVPICKIAIVKSHKAFHKSYDKAQENDYNSDNRSWFIYYKKTW